MRALQATMALYATEITIFRFFPEVANLLWLSESMDLRHGMNMIGTGCLKILIDNKRWVQFLSVELQVG